MKEKELWPISDLINIDIRIKNTGVIQQQVFAEMRQTATGSDWLKKLTAYEDKIALLLRSYMQKLIDDGYMYRLSDIKKMDMLDTTSFLKPPDNGYGMPGIDRADETEQKVLDQLGWYAFIPCFEKGAIKLNKFRYIVFEMLEIDPEEQCVKIRIQDHLKPDGGCWQTGVSTTVSLKSTDLKDSNGMKHYIHQSHSDDLNFKDLYTRYQAKDLGWTNADYDIWLSSVVKNSRETVKIMTEQHGTDQCEQLAYAFTLIITRCNAMLAMNKPSRPVKAGSNSTGSKRQISYEHGKAPERKTRFVGALCVHSRDIPRKSCLETVVTYKVAKWTVRGHVRRYKDGHSTWIPPTVRKRKALEDTDQMTATTIRFKKKGKRK